MKKIVRIPSLASCNADEQEHLLLQHVKKTTRAVYRSMVEATGCKRDLQIAVGSRNPEIMKRIICCVARHIQEGEFAQGTNSPLESLKPKDDSNRATEKIRVMIPHRANKVLPSPMNSSSDFPKKKVGGMKEMAYDRVSAGDSFYQRNVSNEKRERCTPESSKKPKESIVPRELDVDEQHHAKAAKKKSLKAKKKRSLEAETSTSKSLRQPSEHEIKPLELSSAVMQSEPCHNASANRGNFYEIQGTSSSFNSPGKRELMQLRDKNSIPQTVRKKIFEKESGPPERYQWRQPRSAMPGVSAPQPNPREKPPKSSVLTRVSAALARVFQKNK
nr:PREDICTED: uncharacterized protein LOC107076303 isoform X1 [Lepisosteus oculatus]